MIVWFLMMIATKHPACGFVSGALITFCNQCGEGMSMHTDRFHVSLSTFPADRWLEIFAAKRWNGRKT